MKKEIFKNKSKNELRKLLVEKRAGLQEFRFQVAKGKAKNVKSGSSIKKDIARILTEINKEQVTSNE